MYITNVASQGNMQLYEQKRIEDLEKFIVDKGIEVVIRDENSESVLRGINPFINLHAKKIRSISFSFELSKS